MILFESYGLLSVKRKVFDEEKRVCALMPLLEDAMRNFEEIVHDWLSREAPERNLLQPFGLPVILCSDIGIKRRENQDRVAAMSVPHNGKDRGLFCLAVSDGMGGMLDGAECASLTLSGFFAALLESEGKALIERVLWAVEYVNEEVFSDYSGKGGATLSAIVQDASEDAFVVNVGDSRVYALGAGGIERLTVDDSMVEALGAQGRELLQFIGMGAGIQPHVDPLPRNNEVFIITTDGVHYIEPGVFESVITNSANMRQMSERLAALSRWCGGQDNSTLAAVDMSQLNIKNIQQNRSQIAFWDFCGQLSMPDEMLFLKNKKYAWNRKIDTADSKSYIQNKKRNAKKTGKDKNEKVQQEKNEKIQLDIKLSEEGDKNGKSDS